MKTVKTYDHTYLVKQLPQPIALIDTNFDLVTASNSWLSYFEYDLHEVVAKNICSLFPDSNTESWQQCLERCLQGSTEYGLQNKLLEDGTEKWFEWSNSPWYDASENIIGVIVQVQDVTKKMEDEIKFEKLENLLRDQSEISKVGTWEYNVNTEQLEWSEMTKRIHEVAPSYIPSVETAINFYKRGHDRNTIAMLVHNGIHKGEAWSEKVQLITANGNERWVIAAGKALYKEGKVTRLIGTIQDITEEVVATIKTLESEQLLRSIIDNLPLNVFVKDKESRKTLVNNAECEYLGATQEEVLGKTDFDLFESHCAELSREEDLQVMKTLKPIIGKETIGLKKDGEATTFLTSKIPLVNIEGQAKGIIGISVDITNIKQKEDQLRDLINVTSVQNKKLINFAHIVSHNLRSHTANFSMLLDFLVNEKDDKEKKRILDMLLHASDNLMDTLENLNEVVDISTNVSLEKKTLNLNEYITRVQQNLAGFLQKNQVEITNTIPDSMNIKAVPAYLESIILNLLTNAVKYRHPDRQPQIRLECRKQDGHIQFSIGDNGLGIDLNKYGKKLFGMYKTFHNNVDARGIGLYITKNQIEAMGGSIMACSEPEQGSTFNVYFHDD
ncbi:PAS domain-containing sensor histidine kinase [Flagellimonas sp. DF-77]|uniref:PAS domain-containing sensor histidine kinase n=1 Tax=Flagellimonas algarum TaxID=3230298 RepID=UPI003390938C